MSEAEVAAWEALGRAQAYIDQLQALGGGTVAQPKTTPPRGWEVVIVAGGQRKVETVKAESLVDWDGQLRFMRMGADGRHGEIVRLYAAGEWKSVREL